MSDSPTHAKSPRGEGEWMLTDLQTKFCLNYVHSRSASEAAERAGYSEKTRRLAASRNLKRVSCVRYIEELKKKLKIDYSLTKTEVIEHLCEILVDNKKTKPAVSINAAKQIGAFLGWEDHNDITNVKSGPVSITIEMPPDVEEPEIIQEKKSLNGC